MTTLSINGKKVKVSDDFLSLSPEEQNKAVDEIAAAMGVAKPAAAPGRGFGGGKAGAGATGVERTTGQEVYDNIIGYRLDCFFTITDRPFSNRIVRHKTFNRRRTFGY
jgi:hypothetical protein